MSVDLDLVVEQSSDGKWIRERIPCRVLGDEIYELANSPMLVRGVAADDRIRLLDGGHFELVERGGNLAVQVFGEWGEVDALAQHVASIGGRLCGKEPRMRVFSVPLSIGVQRVETVVDHVVRDWPKLTWMFGNVSSVALLIDTADDGEAMLEDVRAFDDGDGVFELLTSPMLAPGAAAGDQVWVAEDGTFEVVAPGGAKAVQTFGDWDLEFFTSKIEDLGGRLDGSAGNEAAVFTFPDVTDEALHAIEVLLANAALSGTDRAWRISNP